MVHHRNWIILATMVLTLIAFIPFAQAGPQLKEGNPGLPGCLAKVNQLEQIIADQNLTILGLQEQINDLQALLDAMKNYALCPRLGRRSASTLLAYRKSLALIPVRMGISKKA